VNLRDHSVIHWLSLRHPASPLNDNSRVVAGGEEFARFFQRPAGIVGRLLCPEAYRQQRSQQHIAFCNDLRQSPAWNRFAHLTY